MIRAAAADLAVPQAAGVDAVIFGNENDRPHELCVEAAGRPLAKGVLYGVDTRATEDIALLDAAIGPDVIHARRGNALTCRRWGRRSCG